MPTTFLPSTVPLSYLDHIYTVDPLIFSLLPVDYTMNPEKLRWSLGADDICFKNKALTWFFTKGKVMSIRRGDGIYQESMNKSVDLLRRGT